MILSRDELRELTERTRISSQQRVLDALGVPYRLRPDGSIVVFVRDLHSNNDTPKKRAPQLRF